MTAEQDWKRNLTVAEIVMGVIPKTEVPEILKRLRLTRMETARIAKGLRRMAKDKTYASLRAVAFSSTASRL